jgi:hypothetical protein
MQSIFLRACFGRVGAKRASARQSIFLPSLLPIHGDLGDKPAQFVLFGVGPLVTIEKPQTEVFHEQHTNRNNALSVPGISWHVDHARGSILKDQSWTKRYRNSTCGPLPIAAWRIG